MEHMKLKAHSACTQPLYNSRVVASSLDKRIHQLQHEDDHSQKAATVFQEGFWGEFHVSTFFVAIRYLPIYRYVADWKNRVNVGLLELI